MNFLAMRPWEGRLLPARERAKSAPTGVTALRFAAMPLFIEAVASGWRKLLAAKDARGSGRRLRLTEKIMVGDKQFVALLELDGETFLASGGRARRCS